MTTLAYSHTLVAGTPENINDVQDMFNDVRTAFNGNIDATNLAASAKPATLLGAYRTVHEATFGLTSSFTGATTWVPTVLSAGAAVGGSSTSYVVCPITLADYAVSGLTTQFRVQALTLTNPTAPAVNFTFGCQLIATLSGGASFLSIASLVASPATVTRSAPAANSGLVDSTSDFTISSSGAYVLTVTTSGTPAASSATSLNVRLQVHNI